MDNTISEYTKIPYSNSSTFTWVNWVDTLISSGMLRHKNIPVFKFRPLDEIRKILEASGISQDEIGSTISGLSELPEYENISTAYKTGKKKR